MKQREREPVSRWIAYHLPKKICYWVLIRVGADHKTIMDHEEVPAVPFTVVLERFGRQVATK